MPIIIIGAFLLLTLVLGIYFSRKKTTFREYAVGNKDFATATLVATVLATAWGGGGLMREVECVHVKGLWWIVLVLLDAFGFLIISKLALRIGPFMQHLSMAESIGSVYGKYPRVIAALFGICSCIVIITMQIIVMSRAISICLGLELIDISVITICTTLLVIFYSTFGGVRAVTYTDVLQFITFSIVIPLLAWFMFLRIGKPVAGIVPMLQGHAKFSWSNLFYFNDQLIALFLLILSNLVSFINPQLMQRAYMASGAIQAQKIFSYAAIFSFIIAFFIVLIGLFVFSKAPDLTKEKIWPYVMTHVPTPFKGFIVVGLLAMAMSTADSCLNACAVMVSHDIMQSLQNKKEITDAFQLKIARRTTLLVGLLAMVATHYCIGLLQLTYWFLACAVPIVTAPFILAVFGFRGTSRTALIGMATGLLAILAWNRWVNPSGEMDGSVLAMLANALAMLAAHYLLKQPEGAGWVKPDNTFRQIQQEDLRRRAARKETIKNAWANKKATLAKLIPSDFTLRLIGLYMIAVAILGYWFIKSNRIHWAICQVFIGAFFTSSKIFFSKVFANWFMGLGLLIVLAIYLPVNLLWDWWSMIDPIFSLSLSLSHLALILWVLPLYLGVSIISATLLLAIYPIYTGLSYPVLCTLFPLFIVGLFLFAIVICLKVKVSKLTTQNIYLKDQEEIREAQQLKASLYEAALVPDNRATVPKGYGFMLKQVVRKIEESISFLDNHTPLFKEDFQSIINKFYDWVAYFNRKEKAKEHALLQPNKITLDRLIRKVEVVLSQQINDPPRLLVAKIDAPNRALCPDMVCDVNQVVYALVRAVLRVGKLESSYAPIVNIQLHPTVLQFKQVDAMDNSCPVCMDFPATALVVSQSTASDAFPKVKACYSEIDVMEPQDQQAVPPSIDLEQDAISSMVRAHYGHLEMLTDEQSSTMLLVFPSDVTDIFSKMTVTLPIDCLTSEAPITPKEQADSMMALMKFHDCVCKSLCEEDPIDVKTISGLILLLRKHFRFKRHASGQLFYVRAVGISEIVVDWVFHSPKVIYASLLYELVRHTCLPLSYVKQHYNLGVYAFVSNVVKIDKREDLDDPSLLCVKNRLEQAIKEDHVQLSVLFIKLAERLYDLRHAAGYIHAQEVQHMAQETLTIDVQIANLYLGPEIAQALEKAAKQALKGAKDKEEEKTKNKNKAH